MKGATRGNLSPDLARIIHPETRERCTSINRAATGPTGGWCWRSEKERNRGVALRMRLSGWVLVSRIPSDDLWNAAKMMHQGLADPLDGCALSEGFPGDRGL